jgi:Putative GTPase activating protein for Arf
MSRAPRTSTATTWRSKLGTEYDASFIEHYNQVKVKQELIRLCRLPENRYCADCGVPERPVVWASVNLGVFLCISCGSHHRGIGTHISKPKGCTGTYLWGPDEIERMRSMGNARAAELYGGSRGISERPLALETSDTNKWRQYLVDKYHHKKFAPPSPQEPPPLLPIVAKKEASTSHQNQNDDAIGRASSIATAATTAGIMMNFDVFDNTSGLHSTTNDAKTVVSEHNFFSEFGL